MKVLGLVLLIAGNVVSVAVIQDVIGQSLHLLLAPGNAGIVMTTYTLIVMFARPCFGPLTDKVGAKRLLLVSLPLMAVSLWGYQLAEGSTFLLTIVRVLNGITYALVVNNIFLVTRESVSEQHERFMTAFAGACVTVGSGLGISAGIRLAHTPILWNVVNALGIFSVISVFGGLALIDKSWVSLVPKAKSLVRRMFGANGVKRVIHKKAFLLALPGLGVSATYASFYNWFASDWPIKADLVLVSATAGNAVVAALVMHRWTKNPKSYLPLMVGSNLLMMVGMLLIWQGHSLSIMITAGILMGVALSGNNLSITEEIFRRVDKAHRGSATATSGFMLAIGTALGTAYSSKMWGKFGHLLWPSMIPVLVFFLAVIFFLWKRSDQMNETNEAAHQPQPLDLPVEKVDAIFALTQGNYEPYSKLLEEIGITGLRELPPYSREPKNRLGQCKNVVEVLVFLEKQNLENPDLPVDGRRFELQDSLRNLLLKLEPNELEEYVLSLDQNYPIPTNEKEVRRFFAVLLMRIRLLADRLHNSPLEKCMDPESSQIERSPVKIADFMLWDRDASNE